jgi:predicted ABC-type ATPase
MQQIIIIAGPNGAGKTSFANQYLLSLREGRVFINADEIARDLPSDPGRACLDLRAGREMLALMNGLAAARREFMFETTLASLRYARAIPTWQSWGYRVGLIYLRLQSVEVSIERVRRRVATNRGHDVPEATLHRRYSRSNEYLESIYKRLVDEWYIWDSLEGEFRPAEASETKWAR